MRYTLGAKIGNRVVTQSCEAHQFILPFESSVKANAYRNFAVLFFNTGVQIGIIEGSGGHYAIYWGGRKFLVTTPFKLSENMGNALFDVFVIYLKS